MENDKVYKILDISKFTEKICGLNNMLIRNGADKNEVLLFRGHSSIKHELIPAIGRGRSFACDITIFDHERNLIEMAKYKLPEVFQSQYQPLELLALLQHHRISTRLLDITENALVALYFACVSNFDEDGEVFVFKNNELNVATYPIVNAIADSYRFSRGTSYPLSLFYGAVKDQPYFLEQKQTMDICHSNNEVGAQWVETCCGKPLFAYAPIKSLRQRMQQGRYILFPNRIESCGTSEEKSFVSVIDPIPKEADYIVERLIIAKEKKAEILKQLRLFGISKEMLFCDSVDTVCESIVGMFSCKT